MWERSGASWKGEVLSKELDTVRAKAPKRRGGCSVDSLLGLSRLSSVGQGGAGRLIVFNIKRPLRRPISGRPSPVSFGPTDKFSLHSFIPLTFLWFWI